MQPQRKFSIDRLATFFELSNTIPDLKRHVFLALLLAGIGLVFFRIVLIPFLPTSEFELYANTVMLIFLTAMAWLLWRRKEQQELQLLLLFFGTALWVLASMFNNLLQELAANNPAGLFRLAAPWFTWLILIYMVAFFAFRANTALRMALLVTCLCLLFLLVAMTRVSPIPPGYFYDFALLLFQNIFAIAIAFPLAQSQERNSQTDFLTALANRNGGYARLIQEIERAQRYEEAFAVILFDIDHFKKINDTCGHPCGDTVLREFAAFVNEHVRRTDILCRWGGEEFLLIMTRADLASARLKANHLRQQISNRAFHNNITLTASFGVTAYYPYDSANTILERVDTALYTAKRNGRNCVEVE